LSRGPLLLLIAALHAIVLTPSIAAQTSSTHLPIIGGWARKLAGPAFVDSVTRTAAARVLVQRD
jgi:hypothetical protein